MMIPQPAALNQEHLTVSFYTPDMKLLSTLKDARVGHTSRFHETAMTMNALSARSNSTANTIGT